MSFSIDDPIVGPSRGTPEQALAYVRADDGDRLDEVKMYMDTLWKEAPKVGLDPTVLAGQFYDETDIGRSKYWNENLNPSGIRITFPGEASHTWKNGREAALGHLHRLSLYANGKAPEEWERYDPHPENVGKAGYLGVARKMRDLSGRWAENTNYANQIVGHLNRSGIASERTKPVAPPTKPVAKPTFGKVPHPEFDDRPILGKPEGTGWNNLGQRTPRGMVLHRMLGTLMGTDGYFRIPTVGALTDYGVGVEETDGAANAGRIIRWNDPRGNRSGWASGPVSAPYGDGASYVNKHGVNSVNKDLVSIEISGHQTTPIDDKAFGEIAALMAYWGDQCRVAWNKWPVGPDGFSIVFWHEEFTYGTGKRCPFDAVKALTDDLIAASGAIMKEHQTGGDAPPPPTYAKPKLPDWWNEETIDDGRDHGQYIAFRRELRAIRSGKVLHVASNKSGKETRAPLMLGEPVDVRFLVRSSSDERLYAKSATG